MPKNILIFSDGTGQAGGFMPDETRSNVYKLYRASRVSPENRINPSEQIAFYDAGLGSKGGVGMEDRGAWRRIYNVLSQATGLGITRNIIDCYSAIMRLWEPGDRIFLFGFSRGAYTARCVAGVLYYCGIPTQMKDGSRLKRDQKTLEAIASEAVQGVYQYGSSIKGDPLKQERSTRARRFRADYRSGDTVRSNCSPYFVGVWDTVATLGAGWLGLTMLFALYAITSTILAWIIPYGTSYLSSNLTFLSSPWVWLGFFLIVAPATTYAIASIHYKQPMSLKKYRMAFYNTNLDPAVRFARHALSIDENRKDFARVPWAEEPADNALVSDYATTPERFKQIWFSGNHSDVGGSYSENESRLSDIALAWMVEEATSLPHPLLIDRSNLNLYPLSSGPQHDERRAMIDKMPNWLRKMLLTCLPESRVGWPEGFRNPVEKAPLHPSVIERFECDAVLIYGDLAPYRPKNLERHEIVGKYYSK